MRANCFSFETIAWKHNLNEGWSQVSGKSYRALAYLVVHQTFTDCYAICK